jgi:hypothetical protein
MEQGQQTMRSSNSNQIGPVDLFGYQCSYPIRAGSTEARAGTSQQQLDFIAL